MRTEQIKAFLDIACEGADYLAQTVERGAGDSEAQEILQHLREIAVLLAAEIDGSGFRQQIHLYAMNLQASIDDLRARPALYERIVRMEIRPFVLEMQRLWTRRRRKGSLIEIRLWSASRHCTRLLEKNMNMMLLLFSSHIINWNIRSVRQKAY